MSFTSRVSDNRVTTHLHGVSVGAAVAPDRSRDFTSSGDVVITADRTDELAPGANGNLSAL